MQDLSPQNKRKIERIAELLDNGGDAKDVAFIDAMEESIKDALDGVTVKAQVDIPPFPEQKAPIVNVEASKAPEVTINVDTEGVTASISDLHTTAKEIKDILAIKEEFEPVQIYDKDGVLVDWKKLLAQSQNSANAGMFDLEIVANTKGVAPLSGADVNGTRDLTSANTWYAVPSTIPAQPYILVATIENNAGTVRWGFDNTGTPSATNGNLAPGELTVRLAPNQSVFYASSTAGDDINWTTKLI